MRIVSRTYDAADATRLVAALFTEQKTIYGHADPPDADPRDCEPPSGLFVVAYGLDGEPVGCGGYRAYGQMSRTVEIKKMYVRPEWRRHGVGARILDHLEDHARASGARRAILETGSLNTAAIGLYVARGCLPTASYAPGRDPVATARSRRCWRHRARAGRTGVTRPGDR
jgi:GNAT superfamily N-acetyltransferase